MLAGIDTVDEGKVYYRSRALSDYTDAQRTRLRRRALAVVFQSFELAPLMNCYRNIGVSVAAGARASGGAAASGAANCGPTGDRKPAWADSINAVSMGQRQRIAIARALVVEPEVVLGDEITASLDSHSSRRIYALLRRQQRSAGRTFVMVTHDSSLAELGDRLLQMRDGRLG